MSATKKPRMTRRRFLTTSATGAAALAAAKALPADRYLAATDRSAAAPALPRYVGAGSTAPVQPFQLYDVTLGNGLFQEKRDRIKDFLRLYDERRFLVLFNTMAGRPNPPGVTVPGGWEDGGQLSGHWTGHYLTALAQAYADQGEQVYRDKLDWMVGELAACQDAITARMDSPPDPEQPPPVEIGRVPGRFGNALRLNGDSAAQYVNLPQETAAQIVDFTIATWVNLASTQTWTRIFDFGQNTAVNAGTNSAMTLNPANLGNPGNVWIGRSQYSDPFLNAAIDEFHVFNRALSQAEIQSLMDSPGGTTGGGNIAWYRFDESRGTDATDSSPNGRAATIVPARQEDPAGWIPTHPGYLGANPEDLVLRLGPPRFATYGGSSGTWAPWYV